MDDMERECEDIERLARAMARATGWPEDAKVNQYPLPVIGMFSDVFQVVREQDLQPLWQKFWGHAVAVYDELTARPLGWKPEAPPAHAADDLNEGTEDEPDRPGSPTWHERVGLV